jgi:hypothetical protein
MSNEILDVKIRIKFIDQNEEPYLKEIDNLDELTPGEKDEFLKIYLRLKKRLHHLRNNGQDNTFQLENKLNN